MFRRLILRSIGALAAVAGLACAASPAVAEPLIAQVRLNGVDTGATLRFETDHGRIAAPLATLAALGLRADGAQASGGEVELADLPGVPYRLDAASVTLDITAPADRLVGHDLRPSRPGFEPPAPAAWGAAINYGVYALAAQGAPTTASLMSEARAFGPAGVLSNSFTLRHAPGDPNDGFQRLDTTYEFYDYDHARRLAVGDFISASLPWTTPVRAAGVSLSTDFSLRPDVITQPLPQLHGASGAPSTVDLYVDGARRYTSQAPAGPFAVNATPMVDGQGRLTMVVTDALGRQTTQTLVFYAASQLLSAGTSALALEAGALRQDYATDDDRYTDPFVAVTARRGLSDSLTAEFHSAASGPLQTAGAGVVVKAGEAALLSAAFDAGHGRDGSGGQIYLAAKRDTGPYSLFASVKARTRNFPDLGYRRGDIVDRTEALAGAAFRTDRWGAISATYSDMRSDHGDFQIANVSWSKGLGWGSLNASALTTFGSHASTVVSVGFTAPLGRGRAASGVASVRGGQATFSADVSESPLNATGWGWRVSGDTATDGRDPTRLEAEVRRDNDYGEIGLGVSQGAGQTAARLYGSGSLVWMGGRPRPAAQVGESFALVETGQPNVEITVENRLIGRTGPDGRLLTAQLSSEAASRIAVKAESVPLDEIIETQEQLVRPPRGAGVVVRLPVRKAASAVLLLVDRHGAPLPVGLALRLNGRDAGVTGFDGQAFVTDLQAENTLEVRDQTGVCRLEVPYVPTSKGVPRLGPLVCDPSAPDDGRDRRDPSLRRADAGQRGPELHGPDRSGELRGLRSEGPAGRHLERLRRGEVHLLPAGLHRLLLHYRDRIRSVWVGHGQAFAQK